MIVIVILALALISGGILSVVNAVDIEKDYVDLCDDSYLVRRKGHVTFKNYYRHYNYYFETKYLPAELCDDFERIRDSQAATAVSDFY